MKIELGNGHPDHDFFRFKLGDKVRAKLTKTSGVVVAGVIYPYWSPDKIFYQVKLPDGKIWTLLEQDIEPVQD